MSTITVVSRTQRIIMNAATQSISVVNAGPPGPPGSAGTDAHIRSVLFDALEAGSGIAIDKVTDPENVTITNTGGVGSYTSENARDDIGAALQGTTDQITVTPDDVGDVIALALAPAFLTRMTLLEQAKALIQVKDNIAAGTGSSAMNMVGVGNYIDTPTNAAYDVPDALTVIARVKVPSTPQTFNIAGRAGSTPATTQWRWSLQSTGQFGATLSVNGTATDSLITTASTPIAFNGAYQWFRFTRSIDGLWDFYTGADDGTNTPPATWTSFQANRAAASGVLFNASGQPLSIGSYNAGANGAFTGSMGRVIFYAGLNTAATVIADANADNYTSGTSWSGGSPSRTWSLHGTASVTIGGTGSTSNTAAEFTLSDTDAFSGVTLKKGDTLMWSSMGTFINTSGSAVNFTPKIQINGVDLFTIGALSIPSTAAGQVYRWELALRVEINDAGGTKQIAEAAFRVFGAVTGDDLGSSVMSAPLFNLGGVKAGAVSTFTTIPVIRLRNTMATAASTISSRSSLTQLFMAAA